MHYLLDSNTFINPKNEYYAFDIAPGFWSQLEEKIIAGRCKLIDAIEEEITQGNDDLKDWVKNIEKETPQDFIFKAKEDENVVEYYRQIAELVYGDTQFKSENKETFLSGADPWIIAAAKAWGDTVVTFEKMPPSNTMKVKIPDICKRMGVPYIDLYEMIRKVGMVLKN